LSARRLLWIGCVLLLASAAEAKGPPARRSEAQRHYDAGVVHYQAQEYAEAVDEFDAAVKLKPLPQWVFGLAQACRLARQYDRSLAAYRQYLALVPDAENRPMVEQRIAEVEKALAAEKAAAAPPPMAEHAPPPVPPGATVPVPPVAAPPPNVDLPRTPYELGARVRGIFVTTAMLMPYLQAATSMESWSIGLEFIYRRAAFDVVTSFDVSSIDVHDGNWLANGHMANVDTHYLQFRGVYFISADVSIIGHHDFGRWVELRYGGGLGVGVVTGNVLTTNSAPACSTSPNNLSNIAACSPFPGATGAALESQLKMSESKTTPDTAGDPRRHVSTDVPPAMGVVNILVGLRIKLPHRVTTQIELGFRDAIFFGVGAHYLF
jgi:hypothetical protein